MKKFNFVFRFAIVVGFIAFLSSSFVSAQIIFKTENATEANFKVFVSKTADNIDLYVYRSLKNEVKPGNLGFWHFGKKDEAFKKVFFVTNREEADFVIYIGRDESLAGWKKPEKKYLLD